MLAKINFYKIKYESEIYYGNQTEFRQDKDG